MTGACSLAQEEKRGNYSGDGITLEELISETEDETYAARVFDDLTYFAVNPLDINLATEEDLDKLYYLSDYQIYCILDYRKSFGDLLSLTELQLIPGLREDEIRHILPYVTIGNPSMGPVYSRKIFFKPKQTILLRSVCNLPLKEGFDQNKDSLEHFTGPPFSSLLRYEIRSGKNLRAGFTFERDPGEPFRIKCQESGGGFGSFFLEMKNTGLFRDIVFGDFRYDTGCGLVKGSGRRGKSSEVIPSQRLSGISRYASTGESGFNRGLALELGKGNFRLRSMVSSMKLSAMTDVAEDSSTFFTGVNRSGLFRNRTESALHDNLTEKQAGAGIGFRNGRISANYNFLGIFYDLPWQYRIRTDRFSPQGKYQGFYFNSFDVAWRRKILFFSGEIALDKFGNRALIASLAANIHPLLTLAFSYRNYQDEYFSPYASSFAESDTRNERGTYFGIQGYPFSFLKVSAYIDYYVFPWLRYNGKFPETGRDALLKYEITLSRSFQLIGILKSELKEISGNTDGPGITRRTGQKNFRSMTQAVYEMNETLRIQTKIEVKKVHTSGEPGSLTGIFLDQDIGVKLLHDRLSVHLRYALFDSPDWSTRIYAYENDLLYCFSTPAFYGTGSRAYLAGKLKLTKHSDLWFKYGVTNYTSVHISGSGPDQREGRIFRDLGLELIVKL